MTQMKYIVRYGMNEIESNSRNAKRHLRNLGGEYVRIETKSGTFVCSATRGGDDSMTVCTNEEIEKNENYKGVLAMDTRKKLAELLADAPYNIYGDRIGNWCFKSGLEIAAGYLMARGVTLLEDDNGEEKQ